LNHLFTQKYISFGQNDLLYKIQISHVITTINKLTPQSHFQFGWQLF